jgi:drug/metabolite transporter (DMT)-like permease
MRPLGIILLVLGILGVAYGGFSYTKEKGSAKIGPVEIEVTEKERVNVPLWAGILAGVAGLALVVKKP